MKKRIILLLILVLLLCGCSAEVNLELTPMYIDETVTITSTADGEYTKENIFDAFRKYVPIYDTVEIPDTEPDTPQSGVEYYDFSQEELSNGYKNTYSYKFDFNKYKNARSANDAFRSINVQNDYQQKTLLLSTDSGGLKSFITYPGLDRVVVNIKTDFEVVKHNADSVNGNVYTWYFSKDTKKGIYLLTKNSKEQEIIKPVEKKEDDEDNKALSFIDKHPVLVGILGIIGFFILAMIVSKIKIKG